MSDTNTARERLIGYALAATPNEVTFEKAGRLADAYRDQVLAEAAGLIRRHAASLDQAVKVPQVVHVMRLMASVIDPEIAPVPIELILRVVQDAARTTTAQED